MIDIDDNNTKTESNPATKPQHVWLSRFIGLALALGGYYIMTLPQSIPNDIPPFQRSILTQSK